MAKVNVEKRLVRTEVRVTLDMTMNEARALIAFLDPTQPFFKFNESPELINMMPQLRAAVAKGDVLDSSSQE